MNIPDTSLEPQNKTASHGRYIKSMIYGGIDGIITTFAVVASGLGANLVSGVLLVLGLANLIADGFSMGFGDLISSRAENEFRHKETVYELSMLEKNPERVKNQIKKIYLNKGFQEHEADALVAIIAHNKEMVVSLFLAERGIVKTPVSPITKSLYTFFSFLFFGSIPLLTYLLIPYCALAQQHTFVTVCLLTGCTLFSLGVLKTRFTGRHWLASGLEMVLLGGVSAIIAYSVGNLFGHLI